MTRQDGYGNRRRLLELERAKSNLHDQRYGDSKNPGLESNDYRVLEELLTKAIEEAKCHTSIPS